jgi:TIR domain
VPGIFISYRREDSEDSTRAIYESLVPRFGRERLFLDVEAITPGSDFRNSIEESLADCGVFLVVIGPNWANIMPDNDPSGPRRLDSPSDFVRQEVATALKKGGSLPVIPVLVRGASMPPAEQLPDDLRDLTYRNAIAFNNLNWDANVAKLIETIRPHVEEPTDAQQAGAVTPPRAAIHRGASAAAARSAASAGVSKGLIIGIVAAVVVAAVIVYFLFGRTSGNTLTVTLVRNPRLTGLAGPIDVTIDDQTVGQIRASANGTNPLQFHVTAVEHRFKFSDAAAKSSCDGTFSVTAQQTRCTPRMRDGGTACGLDAVPGGS